MPQYNGVWTVEQQAQALTNQQWVTDPNFKNTTLLLQADNVNGYATNSLFLDGSTNNNNVVRPTGTNATQGSFSPFSQAPGYWSNYFDGSSYLQTPSTSVFNVGTGNFTFEAWIYPTSIAANTLVFTAYGAGGSGGIGIGFQTTGLWGIVQAGIAWGLTSSTMPTVNQWNHIVACRGGTSTNQTALFLNGTRIATGTYSTNFSATSTYGIGWDGSNTKFSGYISNLRFNTTDVYGYTNSTITVPTSNLNAITNTAILTCQSNRFVDNSTNAFALTIGGTPSVQAFGPFAPALQWTPTVVGGSGYFDGTGDLLSIPSTTSLVFGTGIFTIQCWVYRSVAGVAHTIAAKGVGTSSGWAFQINASNQLIFTDTATNIATTTTTIPAGVWTHVAVVRAGTGASQTTLYINGVSSATGTSAGNFSQVSTLYIGADRATANTFNGYISGLEMVKGTALTISVPTAPPTTANSPSLLLNFTNAGIYDGKMANNLETVGNAQVATSPVKYGSGSMYFNGSTSYLTRPYSPLFALGSGNFTVECWINTFQNGGANYPSVVGRWAAGASWDLRHSAGDNSGKPTFAYNDGTSNFNVLSTGGTVYDGQWHHLAAVRNNNIITLYVDGINVGTSTFTGTIAAATSTPLTVGSTSGGGVYYTGYIDDLRITVGVARYFANFTPPQVALPRQ